MYRRPIFDYRWMNGAAAATACRTYPIRSNWMVRWVCDHLANYFSHPSLVIYFVFRHHPYDYNWDWCKQVTDDFVLIANHLDQSLRFDNLKQRGVVGSSCLLHSSLCSSLLYQSLDKVCTNVRPKPFCWAKPTCFNFCFPMILITLQGQILTTSWVALTKRDSPL
jgi:hypothetical protein